MSSKTSRRFLVVGLLLVLLSPACRRQSVPLVEYKDVSIMSGSGKALSLEDVRRAVVVAAAEGKANWQLSNVEPGRATATLHYKNTVLVVQMSYTENTLSVVGSDDQMAVHPKYNQQIALLVKAIQRELARI